MSLGSFCAASFSNASRKAETSSPSVMRPFRSIKVMPSRSRSTISRPINTQFSALQRRKLFGIDRGVMHLERFQRTRNNLGHSEVAEPFVVCRNHVPRRVFGGALRDGLFVRRLIVVPVFALFEI